MIKYAHFYREANLPDVLESISLQLWDAVDGEPEQRGQVRDRIEMEVAGLMMMTNEMLAGSSAPPDGQLHLHSEQPGGGRRVQWSPAEDPLWVPCLQFPN